MCSHSLVNPTIIVLVDKLLLHWKLACKQSETDTSVPETKKPPDFKDHGNINH